MFSAFALYHAVAVASGWEETLSRAQTQSSAHDIVYICVTAALRHTGFNNLTLRPERERTGLLPALASSAEKTEDDRGVQLPVVGATIRTCHPPAAEP